MKWRADQRQGWFGWRPDRAGAQPLHVAKVDLDEALRESREVLNLWWVARQHEAPPLSGGVLDAWPAWLAEALAVCRDEESAVTLFERSVAHGRPEADAHR